MTDRDEELPTTVPSGSGTLSQQEQAVLSALRAAEPSAADVLNELDADSRSRIIAALASPAALTGTAYPAQDASASLSSLASAEYVESTEEGAPTPQERAMPAGEGVPDTAVDLEHIPGDETSSSQPGPSQDGARDHSAGGYVDRDDDLVAASAIETTVGESGEVDAGSHSVVQSGRAEHVLDDENATAIDPENTRRSDTQAQNVAPPTVQLGEGATGLHDVTPPNAHGESSDNVVQDALTGRDDGPSLVQRMLILCIGIVLVAAGMVSIWLVSQQAETGVSVERDQQFTVVADPLTRLVGDEAISDEVLLAALASRASYLSIMGDSTRHSSIGIERGNDYYFLNVPPRGAQSTDIFRAVISTQGSTDTVMRLYEVHGADRVSLISSDDDGGQDLNSRIAWAFDAGLYLIEITGFDASVTGNYVLRVDS